MRNYSKFLLAYVGKDHDVYRTLNGMTRLSELAFVRFFQIQSGHTEMIYDALIVDCRSHILPSNIIEKRHLQKTTNFIALVCESSCFRSDIYQAGYHDYLCYPVMHQDLSRRIYSCLSYDSLCLEPPKAFQDELVEKACHYMEDNLASFMTLKILANAIGTNRNTLNVRFKHRLNMSPMSWLREIRMAMAAKLLTSTGLSIIQISQKVGYENPANFSTTFKRFHALSPHQYRKKCQMQNNS